MTHEKSPQPEIKYALQIVESITSGVIAVDGEGRVVMSNPAACEHLNIKPDTLVSGSLFSEIDALAPFVDVLAEVARSGKAATRQESRIRVNSSVYKEIGFSISPLEGSKQYNGAILLFTDMTERRKLERAASVNQQLASLGELAAGVVHELRNPLTIISGRAELMRRNVADDSGLVDSIDQIHAEAMNLANSISQFLSFAKPFELKPSPCTAQLIVDRTLALCQRQADAKHVQLTAALEESANMLFVDHAHVAEALSNILSNAIDAVCDGGAVEVHVEQEPGETCFRVMDNGSGIDLASGEDLLSPFFTKKHDGTGLGLSITQRIITAQGGTVSYGNREHGGAWFEVRIPNTQGDVG